MQKRPAAMRAFFASGRLPAGDFVHTGGGQGGRRVAFPRRSHCLIAKVTLTVTL